MAKPVDTIADMLSGATATRIMRQRDQAWSDVVTAALHLAGYKVAIPNEPTYDLVAQKDGIQVWIELKRYETLPPVSVIMNVARKLAARNQDAQNQHPVWIVMACRDDFPDAVLQYIKDHYKLWVMSRTALYHHLMDSVTDPQQQRALREQLDPKFN